MELETKVSVCAAAANANSERAVAISLFFLPEAAHGKNKIQHIPVQIRQVCYY